MDERTIPLHGTHRARVLQVGQVLTLTIGDHTGARTVAMTPEQARDIALALRLGATDADRQSLRAHYAASAPATVLHTGKEAR